MRIFLFANFFGRHQPWSFTMSNLPVVHCLALGATKREFLLLSSSYSSTELLSLLLSTEEVSLLLSLEDNGSKSSTESVLSLIFCNRRRLEPPRTLPLLLLLLPSRVIGGTWMVWAETMMEFIDEDATQLAARRNNFTVLDEIMVMAFLFLLDLGCFELCWLLCSLGCLNKICDSVVAILVVLSVESTSTRLYRAKKSYFGTRSLNFWFTDTVQLKTTTCTTCLPVIFLR